jgi:hypothetical protein
VKTNTNIERLITGMQLNIQRCTQSIRHGTERRHRSVAESLDHRTAVTLDARPQCL